MKADKQISKKELAEIDDQIQKTVQDLGRLSSFSQSTGGDVLSQVREEKMKALRFLREKRIQILDQNL